jgi:hypothetical protein
MNIEDVMSDKGLMRTLAQEAGTIGAMEFYRLAMSAVPGATLSVALVLTRWDVLYPLRQSALIWQFIGQSSRRSTLSQD